MEPTRPAEIRALTGARALPPLLLVLYHYHEGHGYQHWRLFDVLVAKGYLWVEFFFILSGFILIHVYGARVAALWTRKGYGDFLKTRLARLYPLHLATLLIVLLMVVFFRALAHWGGYLSMYDVPGYHPRTDFMAFIYNLLLIQSWHVLPYLTWNGVSWFVSVEFFLCLIFPLFAWISQRGLATAAAMIAFGFAVLVALTNTVGHGLDITFDWGVVRGIGDFSIGVGLAMIYRAAMARGANALSVHAHSLAQAVAMFAFLYAIYHTGWSHHPADVWIVPGLTLLVFTLAFDRGWLAWLLQRRPLMRLGEWSFAVYMGQTTWLQFARFAEQRLYPNPAPQWTHAIHILEPVGLVIAAALWGWFLFRFVEKPANAWLRTHWVGNSRRGAAAP